MEPEQEQITRIMQASGTTRDEALVLYHLEQAARYFRNLPSPRAVDQALTAATTQSFTTIRSTIAFRVLQRDYGAAWGSPPRDTDTPSQM